jgi:hypothetical protein
MMARGPVNFRKGSVGPTVFGREPMRATLISDRPRRGPGRTQTSGLDPLDVRFHQVVHPAQAEEAEVVEAGAILGGPIEHAQQARLRWPMVECLGIAL